MVERERKLDPAGKSGAEEGEDVLSSSPGRESPLERKEDPGREERSLLVQGDGLESVFSTEEIERLTHDIVAALKTVYDPEIPVDVYELGLIYRVDVDDDRTVRIDMTLTAPNCPVAGELPVWVHNAVSTVEGVRNVDVRMVFDPPWEKERMSDEARVALDMF